MNAELQFLGATQTVTGSKYLLTINNKKILVDCGLFQGLKELRLRNWAKLPVEPSTIDAVILTHAHVDHSGYLPLLVKNGFNGKIYCTPATQSLCEVLLPDSAYLQEEAANRANRYGYSKHKPALPLYTREDAAHALERFVAVDFGKEFTLFDTEKFTFLRAGHILGAAMLKVLYDDVSLLFSGDLGRPADPIIYAPEKVSAIDYLVLESTYGNKLHAKVNPADELCDIVNRAVNRGGSIIIPAFAVGRTQHILYCLQHLKEKKRISDIPIFLDSPLAVDATEIFLRYSKEHRLSREECLTVCHSAKCTNSVEESKALDNFRQPKIIISASGMATGGRVLHHLRYFAPNERNIIVFAGYQAPGTRGYTMVQGVKEIKMFGEVFPVNAEVVELSNVSAHADYLEILVWLKNFKKAPKKVFLTHGEPEAALSLQEKIIERFSWNVTTPQYLGTETLR